MQLQRESVTKAADTSVATKEDENLVGKNLAAGDAAFRVLSSAVLLVLLPLLHLGASQQNIWLPVTARWGWGRNYCEPKCPPTYPTGAYLPLP